MRVQSVNSLVLNHNLAKLKAVSKEASNSNPVNSSVACQNPKSVTASQVLSQMPNVSFGINNDLKAYHDYEGPTPPGIEMSKYFISCGVQDAIDKGDYLTAIDGKIKLATICRNQGKENDSFMLEQGMKELYQEIDDTEEKAIAKSIIGKYNPEMAEYLDKE